MARKLRVQFEGAIYHVTARGVEQRIIFDDDRDREHFVARLEECVEVCGVRLYMFCLMHNHFHFLVETPRGNLSAFMHKIQTAHTVYYNVRHQRVGHLLQGRFAAKLVQGDDYLGALSRYVHLNPVYVATNRAKPLEERLGLLRSYKWSSYPGYAGWVKNWGFIDEGPILKMMSGRTGKDRRAAYRRFVEAGVANCDAEFVEVLEGSSWGIGDDEFQAKVRGVHADMSTRVRRREDVAFRRIDLGVKPEDVEKVVVDVFGVDVKILRQRSYGSNVRAVAAKMLMRYSGMNQRDVAGWLNIGTGAAVCQQLTVLRAALKSDTDLFHRVAKMEALLDAKLTR